MTASRLLILSLSFAVSACVADAETADELTPIDDTTAIHMLPLQNGEVIIDSAPAGAHLTDFGGPILKNVHVSPIFRTAPCTPCSPSTERSVTAMARQALSTTRLPRTCGIARFRPRCFA